MIRNADFNEVKLLPGLFKQRADVNRAYLMELNSTALLQNFYIEACIIMPNLQIVENPINTILHWGWEAPICQLRGHFLGHFLSASSMIIASTGDIELKAKMDVIISELARCQKLNGGKWAGSIPEKYFKKLEEDDYIWSPQYTVHKTLLGLLHAYKYTGNEQALDVIDNFADWYVEWVEYLDSKNSTAYLKGEAGGMLEVWAELYEITSKDKYLNLANHYANYSMFDDLYNNIDVLTDNHTNASIPSAHGACKMFDITKDEKWLTIAKNFFRIAVNDRGMYATTGMNAGEFYIPPHQFGKYIGERDQEFCTVYNMVRLADYLFKYTGDVQYENYIEKAIYNGFLAQNNRHTGMPTYFLPLIEGAKKKWGSKRNDFWCCHGTMVQSQAIYPSICYHINDDIIYVNQYIPSEANLCINESKIKLSLNTDMKPYIDQSLFDEVANSYNSRWSLELLIDAENVDAKIALRIPNWLKNDALISLNGNKIDYNASDVKDGYLYIDNKWNKDKISILFVPELKLNKLDDIDLYAVEEGPVVLAAIADKNTGLKYHESLDEIFVPFIEHTYDTYPWQQSTYRTINQTVNMEFRPLYDVLDEQYTVYHTVTKE